MKIVEHKVDMKLAGSPRWWTLTHKDGVVREVVRVILKKGVHYHDPEGPREMLLFALLKVGQYAWPPLVCAALKMGTQGWDNIQEKGGQVVLYEEKAGKVLEMMLGGSGRRGTAPVAPAPPWRV